MGLSTTIASRKTFIDCEPESFLNMKSPQKSVIKYALEKDITLMGELHKYHPKVLAKLAIGEIFVNEVVFRIAKKLLEQVELNSK